MKQTYGRRFRFEEFSETHLPRYNVAPTQMVLGVRNDGRDAVEQMQWCIHGRINARAESASSRSQRNRCIIFADGFFEWLNKRSTYFQLRNAEPFAFAGIWNSLEGSEAQCAIITCEPNALVRPVHDRMPVILPNDALSMWLGEGDLPGDIVRVMLRPYPADAMTARPASSRLNSARYDAPDVLVDDDPIQQGLRLSMEQGDRALKDLDLSDHRAVRRY
ncbi:MAG TPA: SOS response-associated peptidase [Candidatus Baltobacteraceae bacterium]